MDQNVADGFFAAVVRQAKPRRYMSFGHFSVGGTFEEAWASHKSFKPKDSEPDGDRTRAATPQAEGTIERSVFDRQLIRDSFTARVGAGGSVGVCRLPSWAASR